MHLSRHHGNISRYHGNTFQLPAVMSHVRLLIDGILIDIVIGHGVRRGPFGFILGRVVLALFVASLVLHVVRIFHLHMARDG